MISNRITSSCPNGRNNTSVENGGIVCLRRQEANGLRDAIDARDPAAVLEALTRQRATFTAADLKRALAKQIPAPLERAQFGSAILDHAEVVQLADSLGGATTRYTTRSVLASEHEVLKAAEGLEGSDKHAVGTRTCDLVLNSPAFSTMRDEQRRAFIRGVGDRRAGDYRRSGWHRKKLHNGGDPHRL